MTQEAFADKRLLGALDYIDERFIAEVTEDYESFEVPGVYKPNKRAHRRAYRQFAAMAACLILLTSAFPVVGKFLAGKGVNLGGWGGNAGAGTSESKMPTPTETQALNTEPEMTQVLETEPAETQAAVIDSGFDKALERYADMSADEIYADVLKGGWVIENGNYDIAYGVERLSEFYANTQLGTADTVLSACYYSSDRTIDQKAYIVLSELSFDETGYSLKCFSKKEKDVVTNATYEFDFLTISDHYYTESPICMSMVLSCEKPVSHDMQFKDIVGIYVDGMPEGPCFSFANISYENYDLYFK